MRLALAAVLLLAACSTDFPMDASPVTVLATPPGDQAQAPAPLRLPARIGLARTVYGNLASPSGDERAMWEDLATRAASFGSLVPLNAGLHVPDWTQSRIDNLRNLAAQQRLPYLLLVDLDPARGIASASFLDVTTGAVFATAEAASPDGGARGFWGGPIRNPDRLARVTGTLSRALLPEVEAMLTGLAARAGEGT